jgi:PAS domain S-box-containing protein
MAASTAHGLKGLMGAVSAEDGDPIATRRAMQSSPAEPDDWEQSNEQFARTEEDLLPFRRIFEEAPIGMAVLTAEGRFLKVNSALSRLLGYAGDELAILTLGQVTHPEDRAIDDAEARGLWAGERENYAIQKRFVRKDQRTVTGRVIASVLRDQASQAQHRLVAIDETQADEKPLVQQVSKGNTFVDAAPSSAHCSRCKSNLLVRSRWRLWEWPLLLLLHRPVRCRACGRRGFKFLWAGVPGRPLSDPRSA